MNQTAERIAERGATPPSVTPSIELAGLCKTFGRIDVITDVDLTIAPGEFVVFVGPSGSGKSTLLRMIAGLEHITAGTLTVNGTVANDIPPSQRGMAMVFQSYALYPHKNVYNNMSFGLKIARVPRAEIDRRVRAAADLLQLTPYLDRYPRALSGGQRQRVAIGRAIVREAGIFLFDEPLSNLDAALRVATRVEIAQLKQRMPDTTMIYVTHDQIEAMTLADRIVVLNQGRIEQVGTPLDLYARPRNLFVAGFIGSPQMNLFPCRFSVEGDTMQAWLGERRVPGAHVVVAGKPEPTNGTLGIRPEHLRLCAADQALFQGRVQLAEHLGESTVLHVQTADGKLLAKIDGMTSVDTGSDVNLAPKADLFHLFDPNGQALR
jgi:alpha-glucoside transport system ATP-binding protein